jgi:hypothetical protein
MNLLKGIFFSSFDNEKGSKIVCQYPEGFFLKKNKINYLKK